MKFSNRGGEENVKLLERLLKLRSDKAKLLGKIKALLDMQSQSRRSLCVSDRPVQDTSVCKQRRRL